MSVNGTWCTDLNKHRATFELEHLRSECTYFYIPTSGFNASDACDVTGAVSSVGAIGLLIVNTDFMQLSSLMLYATE